MSSASGLTLINTNERNPMKTSTFGFGQMIKDAIGKGAAYVYAPQKGANGRIVKQLDDGLKHFAGLVKERNGEQIFSARQIYIKLAYLSYLCRKCLSSASTNQPVI